MRNWLQGNLFANFLTTLHMTWL